MADGDTTLTTPGIPDAPEDTSKMPEVSPILGSTPSTPADPADPQNQGPKESQGDTMLKEQLRLAQQDTERARDLGNQYEANYRRSQELEALYRQEGSVQPPQLQQPLTLGQFQQQQADAQKQLQSGRNTSTIIGQVLSMAAIGMAVFGHGRNPWANAALMSGAGAFMKNFAEGQTQAGKEQLELWSKNNEAIAKQNEAETKDYHDILSNRHLDLQEQYAMMRDLAAQRQDWKMAQAAASQHMNNVLKLLKAKEDAKKSLVASGNDVVKRLLNEFPDLKKAVPEGWADFVQRHMGINPFSSEEAMNKAREKYPTSTWIASWKNVGKTTTTYEGGKPVTTTYGPEDIYKQDEKGGVGKPGEKVTDDQKKAFQDIGKEAGIDTEDQQ